MPNVSALIAYVNPCDIFKAVAQFLPHCFGAGRRDVEERVDLGP
jgi:hypothetical protein